MKDNVKRVFYVRQVAHPCYLEIIAQRPEIRLDKLENETPDGDAQPIIAAAHASIGGSRQFRARMAKRAMARGGTPEHKRR